MDSSSFFPLLYDIPPEIWVKIFGYVPPVDVFLGVSQTCTLWRSLVSHHKAALPKMEANVRVIVYDMFADYSQTEEGEYPSMQYLFSVYDPLKSDYSEKRRQCMGANESRLKEVSMYHLGGVTGAGVPCKREIIMDVPAEQALQIHFWNLA